MKQIRVYPLDKAKAPPSMEFMNGSNFWSVVVYDALSRSELQNVQALPSVSSYTRPGVNPDGSIDIYFGSEEPKAKGNWIRTVPDKGWFPIFRFYGPAQQYFELPRLVEDIVAVE
jgi:hypothetical protein